MAAGSLELCVTLAEKDTKLPELERQRLAHGRSDERDVGNENQNDNNGIAGDGHDGRSGFRWTGLSNAGS